MLRKGIVGLLIVCCWMGNAFGQDKNALSEKYCQLIEAPTSPEKWDAWRSELRTWKDSTLTSLNYKGENCHVLKKTLQILKVNPKYNLSLQTPDYLIICLGIQSIYPLFYFTFVNDWIVSSLLALP